MAKILLIEDDPTVSSALTRTLVQLGHEVVNANNGRAGLSALRQFDFELIITDLIMPEMEGIETIQHVRRDYPKLPIIAISGGGRVQPEGYLKLAIGMGAKAALGKPFSRAELIEALDQVLLGKSKASAPLAPSVA